MTTITLTASSIVTLADGRSAIVIDGPVAPAIASAAIAATPTVQRTPKAKPSRKARKPLTGEALAKQVAFWSGPASKGQINRLKEAGSTKRAATLAAMSSLEARAELLKLNPAAKAAVIPAEVLAAMQA
jgi:hypothetical protein